MSASSLVDRSIVHYNPAVPELTPEELAAMLAKLNEVIHQAQELSAQIEAKMAGLGARDRPASDWTDRRRPQERRKKQRG
jgi:hypothetical protein